MTDTVPPMPKKQMERDWHEFIVKNYLPPFMVLISIMLGIFLTDYRRKDAESDLAALKAKSAGTGALQISGNVVQGITYEIPVSTIRRCTLSLTLSTAGEVPVNVSSVSVKLRNGKLPDDWNQRLFNFENELLWSRNGRASAVVAPAAVDEAPAPPAEPSAEETPAPPEAAAPHRASVPAEGQVSNEDAKLFVIAPSLPIWSDATKVQEIFEGKDGTLGTIFPNQDRPFAIDFLVADGPIPELVLIEVEIQLETKNEGDEKVRRWFTWIGTGPGLRCAAFQGPNGGLSSTCFPSY